jgi:hypothetical protein
MIMKGKTILLLLAAAGTLSLAGCQKTGLSGDNAKGDGSIRFTASAGAAGTKTAYGVFDKEDAPTWQSIDWVATDQIRIYSDAAVRRAEYETGKTGEDLFHWADYGVTGITAGTASSRQSTATLTNLTSGLAGGTNGLIWGEAASANFYAIYPMPAAAEEPGVEKVLGAQGQLSGSIPASQALTTDGKVDMSYAYMTAAGTGAKPATDNVANVELRFSPAFTAFEFLITTQDNTIKVTKFELIAADSAPALAGAFTVKYGSDLKPVYTSTGTDRKLTYTFPEGTTVTPDKDLVFTVFALPQDLTGLTLRFTILEGTEEVTRTLPLTYAKDAADGSYKSGDFVPFSGLKKHRIKGVALPQYIFNFSYLNLAGEAIEWTDVEIEADNKNYPEATQFEVEGVNNGRYYTAADQTEPVAGRDAKAFRQYWLMDASHPATVKFKVMSPIGFDWLVVPEGDTDAFTITSNVDEEGYTAGGLRGPIKTVDGTAATTNVILYVRAADGATGEKSLHFKTYVISRDDAVQYSIDTETQLLDFRGYHYFILNNSTIVK